MPARASSTVLAVGVARCRESRALGGRESSEELSKASGDRAREGDERRHSAFDARHLEVDLRRRPGISGEDMWSRVRSMR